MTSTIQESGEPPSTVAIEPSVENGVYEIESLCMNCHEDVRTLELHPTDF